MKRTLIIAGFFITAVAQVSSGAPTIHVTWEENETLIPGFHYEIDTTEEGTLAFPNVKLKTGSLTWRVWSSDTNNAGEPGDIGVISSPWPELVPNIVGGRWRLWS